MKRLFIAIAALACAFTLLAVAPSPGFAGGGHGWKQNHGSKDYGRQYRGKHRYGHGHRNRHRSGAFFGFSYYGASPYYGPRYAYPRYYQPPRVIYDQPPAQYVRPDPVYVDPPRARPQQDCLVVREYQTQITVGGRLVDAYGNACMKADGSWERGPPKAVQY